MLPSSVRRVVSTAPQSHLASSLSSSAALPRAAAAVLSRGHQRRCSSSKPSSPDNGSKAVPPGQSVPASSSSSRSASKSSGGEKRKRKSKDSGAGNAAAAMKKLPSVPSTQHLSQEALALSSFFSMHRPISVTHSLPKTVTDDAFAAIFAPRTKSSKMSDVISTLSRTVDDLEGPMAKMTISNKQQEGDAGWDPVHKIDVKHPDGTESSVYVQLNAMAGQFLPFRPPPTPEPQMILPEVDPEAVAEAAEAEAEGEAIAAGESAVMGTEEDTMPQHRVYKAMFTIEETTDPDGQVRVVAHSPKILHDDHQPRTFLERMALRHLRFEEAQRDRADSMLAISVKRQRKLKMKKKKYKKLQRRTRTQRRRLGQL